MGNSLDLVAAGILGFAVCISLVALGGHVVHDNIKADCDNINATVIDGHAYQCWRADLAVGASPAWEVVAQKEHR